MGVATTGARMAHTLLADLDRHGKLDDRLRYEILAGELVIRGMPLVRHEHAVSVLVQHFRNWVTEHGGVAYAGAGIEIGDHQLRPDLTFMGPDRVDEIDADGFHVAPDLVAEVTSPGARSLDLHEKRAIYDEIGVPEYWVVDLAEQRVIVHRRDAQGAYPGRRARRGHAFHRAGTRPGGARRRGAGRVSSTMSGLRSATWAPRLATPPGIPDGVEGPLLDLGVPRSSAPAAVTRR